MMLKKKEQLLLFDKILRLSSAGLVQKDIAKQLEKYGTKKEQMVGKACLASISKGLGFSAGLKTHVSTNAYLCLSSGENVGDFKLGLSDAVGALKVDEASSGAIAKVLIKPLMGMIAVLSVSAILAAYAFPALAEQSDRRRWGALPRSAESFGQFWLDNGGWLLAMLVLVLTVVTWSLSRYTGAQRITLDGLPIYRQYRFIQCTNLLTSIAHQTAVGTSLKEALTHFGSVHTPYMKRHIAKMLRTIGAGKTNVGTIFDSGLLDAQELDTLKLLSDTGDASVILKKSAQMHSEQLLIEIERLKTWGSRILYTLLAFVGGWMALGVGSLAFDLATNIQF
ncbi:hypothetical protein SO574_23495 (plasmid) [Vibrio alfacsensis]|uniref:hypothetical protein n=1 Tax=Vibrio alfacsensis TaxID=1074311 RepID=UPI002ADD7318|nr:hypothetical protein [Vibrio alfacsensis]WQE79439.1 hypothetical protein SO574_23495 [Vibrio alfacsensis]